MNSRIRKLGFERSRRRRGLVVTVVAMGLIAAACGSDEAAPAPAPPAPAPEPATPDPAPPAPAAPAADPVADGVAAAKAAYEQYLDPPPPFEAPGPAIAGDISSISGGEVWYVPLNLAVIPFFQVLENALVEAFGEVGVSVRTCDGAGTPSTWSACIDDAAAQGASGIITGSINTYMAERSFEAATAAGVPVLITNQAYPQPSTTELAFLSWDGDAVNALQADWIIADSNGTANVVVTKISDSTFTASGIENGAVPEFETKCPNCVVDVVDINFGQVELIASSVAAAFSRNPDIDYVMPQYTSVIPFVRQAAQQAGYEDRVRGASSTGVIDGVQLVANGDFIFVEVGVDIYQQGWMAADQVIRMMLGEEPLQELEVPFRVFTEENVGELDLSPEAFFSGAWYGESGYRDVYRELWGIG